MIGKSLMQIYENNIKKLISHKDKFCEVVINALKGVIEYE
jgi:hypothetical protein